MDFYFTKRISNIINIYTAVIYPSASEPSVFAFHFKLFVVDYFFIRNILVFTDSFLWDVFNILCSKASIDGKDVSNFSSSHLVCLYLDERDHN